MGIERFKDRVALITGGGTGIGEATARRINEEGGKVVITGRRKEPIEKVAADIGGIAVAGDTSDKAHLTAAIQTAVSEFGGLDILVANAGVPTRGNVEHLDLDSWRETFSVNLEGALLASHLAIPEMRKRGKGNIVLVSSMAALTGAPSSAPYAASKAAMLGLCRSITTDYGPENIRCNVICPGFVPTEMTKGVLASIANDLGTTAEAFTRSMTDAMPVRRVGEPAEIAAAIAFLASDDASFVHGTVMIVDGGANIIDGSIAPLLNL